MPILSNTYSRIKNSLPLFVQSYISKFPFLFGIKPTVNKYNKQRFDKGILVFSADFEMGWAFRFSKTKSELAEEIGLQERKNFPKLLALFNKNEIPVTWAIVGHLFLSKCHRDKNGLAHSEMLRPGFFENRNWIFNSGDWYQHDPCSNVIKAPAWYAPDLIDLILKSPVKHDIGCHTFSHIDCTDQNCPSKLLDQEIKECFRLAKKFNIELKSFVFPGGTFGNYKVLAENGFLCYRKPTLYQIDMPYIDDYGLVVIPSSHQLEKDKFNWSRSYHIKILEKFLIKTIKYKQVCHFWFHPSMDEWYLNNVLPDLIEKINEFREKNLIEVLTMSELTQKYKNEFNNRI